MRVDLGRGDVRISEQLLRGADVRSVLEQVGREGVPDGLLDHGRVPVIAPDLSGRALAVRASRGKDPLPCPVSGGAGELARQGAGGLDEAGSALEVALVLPADEGELLAQLGLDEGRQNGEAVLLAFARAYGEPVAAEVDVLTRRRQASSRRSPEP